MNKKGFWIVLMLFYSAKSNEYNDTDVEKSVILSRRKRFLIFPEGSSLQLVFCTTYPMIFQISDIFLWGNTAALAWELPQDPYSPFNHKADPLHRRQDTKMIYYTSETGRIIGKRPYSRKLIVNPAFAKRSVDTAVNKGGETKQNIRIDRKQMHASQSKREFLNSVPPGSGEFHRTGRATLYKKIEAMLNGLGTDGKQCMLKSLCVVGRSRHSAQGTFLQEILRATLTLPRGSPLDELEHYDAAFAAEKPCEELYPDCDEPISEPVLRA